MQKNPFKFLDSFTKDDREIFFGRDKEIEELHSRVFESKILLVYGTSGTGKSSLINCGLANKFNDSDWLPVSVRRGNDINRALFEALARIAITRSPFEKDPSAATVSYNLEKLLKSVWLDHFRPVFIIFDQFEELFIFGSREEKNELIKNVSKVVASDIQCRFIFSIREEYLAGVTEFERVIPSVLSNRIRIEKMTRQNAINTIEGPCRIKDIDVEPGFAEALLQKLNPGNPEVELTWLQIYLDKIMKLADTEDQGVSRFTMEMLDKAGDVKDILGSFLEEQVSQLSDPEAGLTILKAFVSSKGTKHQITEEQVIEYTGTIGKHIDKEEVKELIQKFIRLRILRDKDEDGRYELRHDSLASKIYEKITVVEKELLEIKSFIENAFSNYTRRGLLLAEDDLKYIAPYEDKLFLNERSLRFIEESRKELHRARRRRLNIAVAVVSVVIVLLSLFSVWAMRSRKNAITLKKMALEQKDAAVRSKEEADSAKQAALFSKLQAEENARIAMEARNQSETARREALKARENALQQKAIAERMSALANEQAEKAEEERLVAEQQKTIALTAEKEAKRLSLLATAQNLALSSLALSRKPAMMGLLAVQSYNFHTNNGGIPDDPVIFRALDKAWSVTDSSRHSLLKGAKSEIISLAENSDGIVGADIDGVITSFDNEGSVKVIREQQEEPFTSFISMSPDGKHLLTGFENNRLEIHAIEKETPVKLVLTGHNGLVKAAAWSVDGKYAATGGTDSLIIIWNVTGSAFGTGNIIRCGSAVRALAFCGGDSLISANADGSVNLWDLSGHSHEELYSSPDDQVLCLAYDWSRGILLAGVSNGWMYWMDLNDTKRILVRSAAHSTGIDHITFNKDFSLVATSAWDNVIHIYNYSIYFESHDFVTGVRSIEDTDSRTRSLIFSDDDKLVAGMSDRSIRIWETSSSELAAMICRKINRDMTITEWNNYIGKEIPYERTCNRNPK